MSVVSIRGGVEIRQPGEPVPEVIAALESLLAAAQSGQVVGIAYAMVWNDDCTGSSAQGDRTRALLGELEILKAGIVQGFKKQEA